MYAVKTVVGGCFTLGGAILVHNSREELEFLFPGRDVVDVTGTTAPTRPWSGHPGLTHVRFPLRREDFRL